MLYNKIMISLILIIILFQIRFVSFQPPRRRHRLWSVARSSSLVTSARLCGDQWRGSAGWVGWRVRGGWSGAGQSRPAMQCAPHALRRGRTTVHSAGRRRRSRQLFRSIPSRSSRRWAIVRFPCSCVCRPGCFLQTGEFDFFIFQVVQTRFVGCILHWYKSYFEVLCIF